MLTGHDIARHVERIDGIEVVCSHGMIEIYSDDAARPAATMMLRVGTLEEDVGMIRLEHPRAMEAAALLMRAYRAAQVEAGER